MLEMVLAGHLSHIPYYLDHLKNSYRRNNLLYQTKDLTHSYNHHLCTTFLIVTENRHMVLIYILPEGSISFSFAQLKIQYLNHFLKHSLLEGYYPHIALDKNFL